MPKNEIQSMRAIFSEFCPKSEQEISRLWKECIFVFDTNVLLNMYRYHGDTVGQFFGVCSKISDRIWMPYQVCKEFMRNRPKVIIEQSDAIDAYISFAEKLDKHVEAEFSKLKIKMHASVNIDKLVCEISGKIQTIKNELGEIGKNLSGSAHQKLSEDVVLDKLEALYAGKINLKPSNIVELKAVIDERYKKNVPPGYNDLKDKDKERAYGDCLIWFEMIGKAQQESRPIIFITDEKKDDWLWEINGKTLWCRPELSQEFFEKTNNIFHVYNMVRFLELAQKYTEANIEERSIKDVKRVANEQHGVLAGVAFVNDFRRFVLNLIVGKFAKDDIVKIKGQFAKLSKEMDEVDFLRPTKVMHKLDPILTMLRRYDEIGGIQDGVFESASNYAVSLVVKYRRKAAILYDNMSFGDGD